MKNRRLDRAEASTVLPWYRSTFAAALAGGLVLFLSFPPANLWPLAWVAPIFWLVLAQRRELSGRRPFCAIWLASAIHWLIMLQGIRLAHWANNFGWVALSLYLGLYLPAFILLTRVGIHRLRLPLAIVAPAVWTGLEFVRGHLITGFSMALIGHTQMEWTSLLQISDIFGAYGVSFVLLFVAVCITRALPIGGPARRARYALAAGIVLSAVLGYGYWRVKSDPAPGGTETLKVALIQESVDKVFDYNPERNARTFQLYLDSTLRARERYAELDLIVWPESAFTGNVPDLIPDDELAVPPQSDLSVDEYRDRLAGAVAAFEQKRQQTAEAVNRLWRDGDFQQRNIHLLVGTETVHLGSGDPENYNSALLLRPDGAIAARYYKMHPVMFGEYIPFGRVLPWIYRLTPMSLGLTPGDKPVSFEVAGWRLSPSICFESTVPHLIRRQVVQLTQEQTPPDVLVNVTDDGWFRGSSILDLQLACAVFRAVELRRPFLVAANTGISAWIDGSGVIRERGPRRDKGVILADVRRDARWSGYLLWGDLPAGFCLVFCAVLAIVGARQRLKHGSQGRENQSG